MRNPCISDLTMLRFWNTVGTYGLESCYFALTGRNIVDNKSTNSLASILVIEEIPIVCMSSKA